MKAKKTLKVNRYSSRALDSASNENLFLFEIFNVEEQTDSKLVATENNFTLIERIFEKPRM